MSIKPNKTAHIASFTLLEVMISATLIAVGVASVVRCISTGVFADNSIEGKLVALNYAVQEMETLNNTAYATIISNGSSSDTPATGYSRSWTITNNTNYLQATVTVSWYYKSRQMSVNLATYIANAPSS